MASVSTANANASLRTLVQSLMAQDRRPLTQLQSQKSERQAQLKAYQGLGSRLSSLLTLAQSYVSPGSQNPFLKMAVTASDPTVLEGTVEGTALLGTHAVDVQRLATRQSLASSSVRGAETLQPPDGSENPGGDGLTGTVRFRLGSGDTSVDISATIPPEATFAQALAELARAINSSEGPAVASVMAPEDGQLVLMLQAKTSGRAARVNSVTDLEGGWMQRLGLAGTGTPDAPQPGTLQEGEDASFLVDGLALTSSENTVKDLLPGLSLTLKAAGKGPQTLTIRNDSDAVLQEVQRFLTEYNKTLNEVRNQTQPADASGNSRGLLAGEPTIARLRASLRDVVTRPVDGITGANASLSRLGITADRQGQLTLSKPDALRAALEADPSTMEALWTGAGGIGTRLADLLKRYSRAGGLLSRQQDAANARIRSLDTRIVAQNQRLSRREEELMKQLAQVQATVGSLTNQQTLLGNLITASDQLFA